MKNEEKFFVLAKNKNVNQKEKKKKNSRKYLKYFWRCFFFFFFFPPSNSCRHIAGSCEADKLFQIVFGKEMRGLRAKKLKMLCIVSQWHSSQVTHIKK